MYEDMSVKGAKYVKILVDCVFDWPAIEVKMLVGITKVDLLLELVVSFAKRNQCAVNWNCFRGQVILLLTPCREEQDPADRIINPLLYS